MKDARTAHVPTELIKRVAQAITKAMNEQDCSPERCGLGTTNHTDYGCSNTVYGPEDFAEHTAAAVGVMRSWLLDQLEQARAELRETQSSVRFEEQRADGLAKAYEQTRVERDEARRDHAAASNQAMDADEEIAKLRAELATVRATRKHVRAERDQLRGERDRARATAVALEQDAAVAEEARQAWAKTADERLTEVEAERDQLAAAIQRVCDLPLLNFTRIDDLRVAAAARAWSEVVADLADLSAQLEETGKAVPDGN